MLGPDLLRRAHGDGQVGPFVEDGQQQMLGADLFLLMFPGGRRHQGQNRPGPEGETGEGAVGRLVSRHLVRAPDGADVAHGPLQVDIG